MASFEIRYIQVPELRWDRFRWIGGQAGTELAARDLFSVSKDGAVAWQAAILFPKGGVVVESLAWEEAGLAAFGGGSGVVLARLASGEEVATIALEGGFEGFVVAPDRLVVVSSKGLVAIDSKGSIAWRSDVLEGGLEGARIEGGTLVVRRREGPDVTLDTSSGRRTDG